MPAIIIPVEEVWDRLLDRYEKRYAYGVDSVETYIANMKHMGFEEEDVLNSLEEDN